jgi:hypothetical protein
VFCDLCLHVVKQNQDWQARLAQRIPMAGLGPVERLIAAMGPSTWCSMIVASMVRAPRDPG